MTTALIERRKSRLGRVVADKMDKTVIIAVDRRVHHRLYGKVLKRVSKIVAHDEANEYRIGDVVRVVETRPLSRTKRWRVIELIRRAESLEVAVDEASVADQPVEEPVEAAPEEAPVAEAEPVTEEAVEEEPEAEAVPEEAPVAEAEPATEEATDEEPAPARKRRATTAKPRAAKKTDDAPAKAEESAPSEDESEAKE